VSLVIEILQLAIALRFAALFVRVIGQGVHETSVAWNLYVS
jgi:hypothetical protein